MIAQHPFHLTTNNQNMPIMIFSFPLLVTRINIDPIKAKKKYGRKLLGNFSLFIGNGKNLTFNEIAELMYQPDPKPALLPNFQICEIITVFNV